MRYSKEKLLWEKEKSSFGCHSVYRRQFELKMPNRSLFNNLHTKAARCFRLNSGESGRFESPVQ